MKTLEQLKTERDAALSRYMTARQSSDLGYRIRVYQDYLTANSAYGVAACQEQYLRVAKKYNLSKINNLA